jgi:hypothetical protein
VLFRPRLPLRAGLVDTRFVFKRVAAFRFGEDFDPAALAFVEARCLVGEAFVFADRCFLAEVGARFLRAPITAPDTAPTTVPTTGVPTALPTTAPATAPPKALAAAPFTLELFSFLLSSFISGLPWLLLDFLNLADFFVSLYAKPMQAIPPRKDTACGHW